MKTLVIMPGGFHPFHAGHASLYKDAVKAFPGADVYVTAVMILVKDPSPSQLKKN